MVSRRHGLAVWPFEEITHERLDFKQLINLTPQATVGSARGSQVSFALCPRRQMRRFPQDFVDMD
jgi:hypothetical protein